ncbi:hypothetical protein CISG_08968 [Coccidioides immitis RMSCC 3703]|uniref:Uncharacterized protein n=1 Tax=Coccidioides immitis RMSCC 3703 TaxID=454286 RepID=A0A0J8RAF6_COCIT|nr:hypothetical protein CISG_08968 [Coccidioides immitis RMSCC 3703]
MTFLIWPSEPSANVCPSRRQEARGGAVRDQEKAPGRFPGPLLSAGSLLGRVSPVLTETPRCSFIALYVKSPSHMFNGVFKPSADSPGSIAPTPEKRYASATLSSPLQTQESGSRGNWKLFASKSPRPFSTSLSNCKLFFPRGTITLAKWQMESNLARCSVEARKPPCCHKRSR